MKTKRKRVSISFEGLACDCIFPAEGGENARIQFTILDGKTFRNQKNDAMTLKWTFDPPVAQEIAAQTTICISFFPSNQPEFCRFALDPAPLGQGPGQEINLLDGRFRYRVFPSHAVQLVAGDSDRISTAYLQLSNAQFRGDASLPIVAHDPNLGLGFYREALGEDATRFQGLPWFPPDFPTTIPLPIPSSQLPQRHPMWWKMRGSLTGSKIPRYLGYYIPEPGSKEKFSMDALHSREFGPWQAAQVREGRILEDFVVLVLLRHHPDMRIAETGYWPSPADPHQCGASPDGIVDGEGCLEIKCSRWNCKYSGAHVAQVVWEMMCTELKWGDLVRFRRGTRKEDTHVTMECKTIRLRWDAELERETLRLVKQARQYELDNGRKDPAGVGFQELVHSAPYRELREKFDKTAEIATECAAQVPVRQSDWELFESYPRRLSESVQVHVDEPIVARLEKRQAVISSLCVDSGPQGQRQRELLEKIARQIQELADLIQQKCV